MDVAQVLEQSIAAVPAAAAAAPASDPGVDGAEG
jgi:hypothetical protein